MCWDKQLKLEFDDAMRRWNKKILEKTRGKFKFPYHHVFAFNRPAYPIITNDRPDEFTLGRWTLVPSYIESEDVPEWVKKSSTANAKSETIYKLPSFRGAANAARRCLVPVTGWYEYRHFAGKTYPYVIKRIDRDGFTFGGLWERREFNVQEVTTYNVLTTTPNKLAAAVHNNGLRMPVIIPDALHEKWLDPKTPHAEIKKMLVPYQDGMLEAWPVDRTRFRNPKVNSNVPEVDAPFSYPELPVIEVAAA